jgi:hypothetical protein
MTYRKLRGTDLDLIALSSESWSLACSFAGHRACTRAIT